MMFDENEINIRSATNADCERIQNLVFGVLREYGLKPETEGTDADLSDIETNYFKSGGLFEILENADGKLLGTIGLFPINEETIELRKMYFDASLRGRGFGKKMLERMIETARRKGYKKIYLETASILKEAIGLYEKYGFKPTREGMHSKRCDAAYFLEL